jgi:prophage DNA circulation protein
MMAGQQFNVDTAAFTMESIKDTQTVVAAMKAASVQIKVEQKKININEIEDMQDDMEDMFEDMNDINEVLYDTLMAIFRVLALTSICNRLWEGRTARRRGSTKTNSTPSSLVLRKTSSLLQ